MIAALLAGRMADNQFPGRNTLPILGRPMMAYPILAALNAQNVDLVFLSTDAPPIARIGQHLGVGVIDRPPELTVSSATLEQVLLHAYRHMTEVEKLDVEAIVLLLCNAPTVTGGLIDQGIEILRNEPGIDAIMSVSTHNEYHPSNAMRLSPLGRLEPYAASTTASSDDVYFADALLWILRAQTIRNLPFAKVPPNSVVNPSTQHVFPLVHQGYGDVDYPWQIPAVEEWLQRHGFSEDSTPYPPARAGVKPAATAPAIAQPGANGKQRVLITTVPFGEMDRKPLELLEEVGVEYCINPFGRKLKENELAEIIGNTTILIAGTEKISAKVMDAAPRLQLISRVGIGLDSVDLAAARERGIIVSYTPDAPTPAVAELTIGLMVSLLRSIPIADRNMRNGVWLRKFGRRLAECTVGIIGIGRVGKRVVRHLSGFGCPILANDIDPDWQFGREHGLVWLEKDQIYQTADIITVHVPLTQLTHRLITRRELDLMKPTAVLLNTARGSIVDEHDLGEALRHKCIAGAAIDVFSHEPYAGELCGIENCVLTSHMGSMSIDCRVRMEIEATEEAVRFLRNEPLLQVLPEAEYELCGAGRTGK